MSATHPLVLFITALLPGDDRARRMAEIAASGTKSEIAAHHDQLFAPQAYSTDPRDSALNLVITYLLTLADITPSSERPEGSLDQWHADFEAMLQSNGGERQSLAQVASDIGDVDHPAVMPLIVHYHRRFLDLGLALTWLNTAWEDWLFLALPPDVARCWDGVAIELGDERLEITSALDKAEPYILDERPDLAMMLRGLPPRLAEPGQPCPAFPALMEAPS